MVYRVVNIQEYKNKIKNILKAKGVCEYDAEVTASVLIDADICGPESHGMTRLPSYVDRLQAGSINPKPEMKDEINGAVALVDGDNGLGPVVTQHASELAMELADRFGISCVAVSHSNHFGAAAYYTKQMAAKGYIGFVSSVAGKNVAPHGGMDRMLGTSPFSVAFPGNGTDFCTDMATSAAAKGKIRIYDKKSLPIPQGWALDAEGNDTTDAKAAINGVLLPMAAHKGYAIAMIVDALSGLLSGSSLSCESAPVVDSNVVANTGHCVICIKISSFLPEEQFRSRAQNWFDAIRCSRKRPGFDSILIPGEIEANRAANTKETISVLENILQTVDEYHEKFVKY